jgi:hypothetical protein
MNVGLVVAGSLCLVLAGGHTLVGRLVLDRLPRNYPLADGCGSELSRLQLVADLGEEWCHASTHLYEGRGVAVHPNARGTGAPARGTASSAAALSTTTSLRGCLRSGWSRCDPVPRPHTLRQAGRPTEEAAVRNEGGREPPPVGDQPRCALDARQRGRAPP